MKASAHKPPSDEQLIRLGEQARQLGCDPMFDEALGQIINDQYKIISQSAPENIAQRESCYQLIRAIDHIRTQINTIQDRGDRVKARGAK